LTALQALQALGRRAGKEGRCPAAALSVNCPEAPRPQAEVVATAPVARDLPIP
jgi:hypothetical protein